MSRLPPIPPQDLNEDQKEFQEFLSQTLSTQVENDFVWQRPDGALIGPLASYLYAPKQSRLFLQLLASISSIPGLSLPSRETAVLALGAKYDAKYMIYAHERIAVNHTSLTAGQIQEIKVGKKPVGLGEAESVAYDVTVELVSRMKPLSEGAWERAVKTLGREGAVGLVHFVGFYAYTAMLLNGFDVPLPEGEAIK